MKVLFVAKDMGSAHVTSHLAKLMREEKHEIVIVAEGLAASRFEALGLPLYFKGTVNFKDLPFTLDAVAILKNVRPDFVMTGLGSPINLEQQFGLAANELGIPLGGGIDFWCGSNRSKAKIGLVLTLDEYAAELDRQNQPNATVQVVGNPGVTTTDPNSVAVPPQMVELRAKFDKIITYIGGGARTAEEISILIECLALTVGNWVLVPRFHPKWSDRQDPKTGRKYSEVWKGQLELLMERVVYLNDIKSSEAVVIHSDIVTSGYSTLLTTSAACGRATGSLWIPAVQEELKREARLDAVPIVKLGCAQAIEAPINLETVASPSPENRPKLKPYDVKAAYNAVMKFVFDRQS